MVDLLKSPTGSNGQRKTIKTILRFIGLFLLIILVIAVIQTVAERNSKKATNLTQSSGNLSARDLSIYAKEEGYTMLGPFDVENDERLNFKNNSGVLITVFYRNDKIKEVFYTVQITDNRNNLQDNYDRISNMVKFIDGTADEWLKKGIKDFGPKSSGHIEDITDKRSVTFFYTPDVDMDIMNIEYKNKLKKD